MFKAILLYSFLFGYDQVEEKSLEPIWMASGKEFLERIELIDQRLRSIENIVEEVFDEEEEEYYKLKLDINLIKFNLFGFSHKIEKK